MDKRAHPFESEYEAAKFEHLVWTPQRATAVEWGNISGPLKGAERDVKQYSCNRAFSLAGKHFYGMEKSGVRFPQGPPMPL